MHQETHPLPRSNQVTFWKTLELRKQATFPNINTKFHEESTSMTTKCKNKKKANKEPRLLVTSMLPTRSLSH